MGYMRHHAIVVTYADYIDSLPSYELRRSKEVLKEIAATGATIIGPSKEVVNGYRSILVCPDGSKEGWSESAEGDRKRDAIVAILRREVHSDGSGPWKWAEVQYGDDDKEARITRHCDEVSAIEPVAEEG